MVVVTLRVVLGKDPRSDHTLHFPLGHFSVQGIGDNDVHVVDAVTGEHVENNLEDRLADVGCGHRRQRQTDIVNSDSHTHAWLELRE